MSILDIVEDRKNIYLVFEQCQGTTLYEHIMNEGSLEEGDTC
jgi:serine/threonine protein kinase